MYSPYSLSNAFRSKNFNKPISVPVIARISVAYAITGLIEAFQSVTYYVTYYSYICFNKTHSRTYHNCQLWKSYNIIMSTSGTKEDDRCYSKITVVRPGRIHIKQTSTIKGK